MTQNIEKLEYGSVTTIPCGDLNIRVYTTNDAIDDQVILLEKKGKGVVIELPAFHNSIEEMTSYLKEKGIEVEAKLVSYHAAGPSFLPDVKNYLTESSVAFNTDGQGAQLIKTFSGAFGEGFDSGKVDSGERLDAGMVTIAGIDLEIIPNGEAFEVYIPQAKAVYVHMLGHDCHSIVAGEGYADAIIANLKGYLGRGTEIFLSSHYVPETREDVETKISYLEKLKAIARGCSSAAEFKEKVNKEFPGYSGGNYLDMTAGFFFKNRCNPQR
jgi:hypothetical protein